MPLPVCNGATLSCSFGMMPSTLVVPPVNRVMFENQPVANITDAKPFVNILPFGLCSSLANPITASQTAAALGVLTPGTCTPTTASWMPGAPKTLVGNAPTLTQDSKCMCGYGGVIQVVVPGSLKEQVS